MLGRAGRGKQDAELVEGRGWEQGKGKGHRRLAAEAESAGIKNAE